MTMIVPNDVPDAPDWAPTPREWDAARCCPADCTMCGDLEIPTNIILGGDAD